MSNQTNQESDVVEIPITTEVVEIRNVLYIMHDSNEEVEWMLNPRNIAMAHRRGNMLEIYFVGGNEPVKFPCEDFDREDWEHLFLWLGGQSEGTAGVLPVRNKRLIGDKIFNVPEKDHGSVVDNDCPRG